MPEKSKEEQLKDRLEAIEYRLDRIEQLLTSNFDTVPYGIEDKEELEREQQEKLEKADRDFLKEIEKNKK